MSCSCFCCRKPRYKRLVDSLFPEDPQDGSPVTSHLDKLLYFARDSPEHLDRIGEHLVYRLRRSLGRDKLGHVAVALKITEKLLSECDPQRLQLLADSYLNMLHLMLESTHTDVQIMATNSFGVFAEREEESTPYHRQYDFFIHRFASLSLAPNAGDQKAYLETRMAGVKGLRGVTMKIGREEGSQINIWDMDHINKIVPAFLFNMQDHHQPTSTSSSSPADTVREIERQPEEGAEAAAGIASYAEEGLRELVSCAGLGHIDSVIKSVLLHFDLSRLWTQQKEFAIEAFVIVIKAMPKQDRYKGVQALVSHLDTKVADSSDTKQGILDTLSQCVAVAADDDLGPSVLDVFRTLVKHLRMSIESGNSESASDSGQFQNSLTRTMGEFAGVLPDYHKPDILNLINSYMLVESSPGAAATATGGSEPSTIELPPSSSPSGPLITASLVKCLQAVADTYHPAVLETGFPAALFTSLVQLFHIAEPGTQRDVSRLWHQLIDHHGNKEKIPLNTEWENLDSEGLILGKVSQRFVSTTASSLYSHLVGHAAIVATQRENNLTFYRLLFLLTLEFSHNGVRHMVDYLNCLQDMAVKGAGGGGGGEGGGRELSVQHRVMLHAVVAGILYLVAKITSSLALEDHILSVVAQRRTSAPGLLPDAVFAADRPDGGTISSEAELSQVEPGCLFRLKEEGLLRDLSPELKGSFSSFARESTMTHEERNPLHHNFSVSLDYGPDSPLSMDQISFNTLKERELELAATTSPSELYPPVPPAPGTSPTFSEMVGKASLQDTGLDVMGLADILNRVVPAGSEPKRGSVSAYDVELPALH